MKNKGAAIAPDSGRKATTMELVTAERSLPVPVLTRLIQLSTSLAAHSKVMAPLVLAAVLSSPDSNAKSITFSGIQTYEMFPNPAGGLVQRRLVNLII